MSIMSKLRAGHISCPKVIKKTLSTGEELEFLALNGDVMNLVLIAAEEAKQEIEEQGKKGIVRDIAYTYALSRAAIYYALAVDQERAYEIVEDDCYQSVISNDFGGEDFNDCAELILIESGLGNLLELEEDEPEEDEDETENVSVTAY